MTTTPVDARDPAERIRDAIAKGELGPHDLTVRQLGAFLGKTTGHVYHRWGSLDGLLYAVGQATFATLAKKLGKAYEKSGRLADVAVAFVDFGLEQPTLYALMFEHRYDWEDLRKRGVVGEGLPGVALFRRVAERFGEEEARLLYAGLHGLVSLAATGRANVGAMTRSDREVARASARRLAELLTGSQSETGSDSSG